MWPQATANGDPKWISGAEIDENESIGGPKVEPKSMKMRSWVLWVAFGAPVGSRTLFLEHQSWRITASGEHQWWRNSHLWPLGCPFGALLEPIGGQRGSQNPPFEHHGDINSSKRRSRRGSQNGVENGTEIGAQNGRILRGWTLENHALA